eukprot:CAMPEP_0185028900 /NCGR_PEP_ID=MMETSP1103-20130426/14960_1 /TAXON_ID=36769 /ORGANISM="Paraphysomonas bandaiensis, Strain Caron Lab Isolate" /LENGTH=882 /DNA_ID=CAMNT_0027563475 /DNA_START=1 /DNA_END=2646 /DNA_ORIENTATION=+
MSFLGMNTHQGSWAYRASGGFARPKNFEDQCRSTPDLNSYDMARPQTAHGERIRQLNKTMSEMQFSRPATACSLRPKSASSTRPSKGASQRLRESLDFANQTADAITMHTYSSEKELQRPTTASGTLRMSQSFNKVPKYVETYKQVLRFYCHFFDKDVQRSRKPLRKFRSASTARLFTLLVYVEDTTCELAEERTPNSGIVGGPFYKRGALLKSDGTVFEPTDFSVGGCFTALGHDFFITDCDDFTREFYRREFGIVMAPGAPRPAVANPAIGAQNSTGLGGTRDPKNSKKNYGTRSVDYFEKKELLDKTNKFINFDNRSLRFRCIEVTDDPHNPESNGPSISYDAKKYLLTYTLCDDMVEVRMFKSSRKSSHDPKMLLKKSKLPKNWQDVPRHRPLIYYSPDDFHCGAVIDVYGRKLLILGCDNGTRQYYAERGIQQDEIELEEPKPVLYEQPVPQLGDGFLAIGGEADTLHTVYGHPKPQKNWKKIQRNLGQIIRCRCKLLSANAVDSSRNFMLTFHLEDDTIGVYEEVIRNSGVVGGNFLKRGVYVNGLPPDSNEPRPFIPTDIYLGNVILLNGYEMQITEMDDMSVRFCEENSDEFPFFDTFAIINNLMDKVLEMGIDIRDTITRQYDTTGSGWLKDESFVKCLDDLEISQEMNDQELMTMMRRFKEVLQGNLVQRRNVADKYYYHEMCDLFSHAHCIKNPQSVNKKNLDALGRLLHDLRSRQTQWRRALRMDIHSVDHYITIAHLISCFAKSGLRLSLPQRRLIVQHYAIPSDEAEPLLPKLNQVHDIDQLEGTMSISHAAKGVKKSTSKVLRSLRRLESQEEEVDTINRRRSSMGTSILRSKDKTASAASTEEEFDPTTIVIDFDKFCNDIYVCDW